MRAKEFIIERSFPKRKSGPLKAMFAFPSLPSSNAYLTYRFGMAMADHTIGYPEGPTSNSAVIVAYTPEEEEIIKAASGQTGHHGDLVADRDSHEPESTNNTSPVARVKKNRFGV